jgi:dethiobiotin synthetase
VRGLAATRQQVLVEGAGGLLVRYDPAGGTIADLALALGAAVLVVAAPGLGTLNHTALTLEALASRGITLDGLILGSWPENPGIAERNNITDLEVLTRGRVHGVLNEGAGTLDRAAFLSAASAGLAATFGGCFDPEAFREINAWQKERV